MKKLFLLSLITLFMATANAQTLKPIKLNTPNYNTGKPLMQVLKNRKSEREFSDKKLSQQELSELLWAANGINREDGKRTAPTAMNKQEVEVYAVMSEGVYKYNPKQHELTPVAAGDFRKNAGTQDFVATAPLNLIYVVDLKKINANATAETDISFGNIDTGFAAQNAYLYCSSAGLACVVRAYVDKVKLAEIMKLEPTQKIIVAQTIGYPKGAK